jgi:hypothetical protein
MPFSREALLAARLGTALARAAESGLTDEGMRQARTWLNAMAGARSAFGKSYAAFYGAQLAFLEGDTSRAAQRAVEACRGLDAMGDFHARLADVLVARAQGLHDASDREQRLLAWFASEGFVNPVGALYWLMPIARTWH